MKYDINLVKNKSHGNSPDLNPECYRDHPFTLNDLCVVCQRFLASGMAQNYASLYFWEHYQASYEFEYIVEFGSQKGALSTYFANMAAISEKFIFDTFEFNKASAWNNRSQGGVGHWFEKLSLISPYINSYELNVFSDEAFSHVKENVDQFRSLIFCDGGNKVAEFNMYAPLLKVGDRIVVHDWNLEIYYNQIEDSCVSYGLVPDSHWVEINNELGTLLMPFVKV